jgi:peptide deformylase
VAEEGCLSFPDIMLDIERATEATVEALNLDGEPFVTEIEGLMARAVLHEIEHLGGETFLCNLSALKRGLIKKRIRKRIHAGEWVEAAVK